MKEKRVYHTPRRKKKKKKTCSLRRKVCNVFFGSETPNGRRRVSRKKSFCSMKKGGGDSHPGLEKGCHPRRAGRLDRKRGNSLEKKGMKIGEKGSLLVGAIRLKKKRKGGTKLNEGRKKIPLRSGRKTRMRLKKRGKSTAGWSKKGEELVKKGYLKSLSRRQREKGDRTARLVSRRKLVPQFSQRKKKKEKTAVWKSSQRRTRCHHRERRRREKKKRSLFFRREKGACGGTRPLSGYAPPCLI